MAITVKRATATFELCTDMEKVGDHEALSRQLAEDRQRGVVDDRLTGNPLARKITDLEKAMLESTVVFKIQALPRKVWAELEAAHKPREGNENDQQYGVNVSTFIDAVLALPGTVVSVTEKASGESVPWVATDWAGLADELTDGQWTKVALSVLALNRGRTEVPFNLAASLKTATSGEN